MVIRGGWAVLMSDPRGVGGLRGLGFLMCESNIAGKREDRVPDENLFLGTKIAPHLLHYYVFSFVNLKPRVE